WQLVEDENAVRNLERGQLALQEPAKLRRCRLRAKMRNDGGCDVLAKAGMGDRESGGLSYGRMAEERGFNLSGRNLLTAAVDQFAQAAVQGQEAVSVEAADIARAKPTLPESSLIQFRRIEVTGHHVGALNPDLTPRANR